MDCLPIYLQANMLTTVFACGAPRTRSPRTTDKLRILGDLLDDALQGLRDPCEAAAIYDAQSGGRGGRPRRFPTFASYVRDRIAWAADPAHDGELLRLLVASTHRRTGQVRSAMTVQINRLLDETGQDRATRLRDLLADLAVPACGLLTWRGTMGDQRLALSRDEVMAMAADMLDQRNALLSAVGPAAADRIIREIAYGFTLMCDAEAMLREMGDAEKADLLARVEAPWPTVN